MKIIAHGYKICCLLRFYVNSFLCKLLLEIIALDFTMDKILKLGYLQIQAQACLLFQRIFILGMPHYYGLTLHYHLLVVY